MKLKFMNKMIAIMCAATVATSGVVTSVGAVGETEAIEQMAIEQMKSNIWELGQKQKELEQETSREEKWLKNKCRTKVYQQDINNIKAEIKKLQIDINDIKGKVSLSNKDRREVIEKPNEYRQEVIKKQSDIEKLKQKRARVNRNSIELINKNKKALKVIKSQIKDAKKQVEFMEAFQELGNKISEFTIWNASKKAVVSYTDVIKNTKIITRCLELKNNFQARRANAIIQQIKKSINQMQQYRQKYELKHTNENNPTKLVKAKKNEAIKNSKMLGHKSKENGDSNTSNKLIDWKANGTFGGFSGNVAGDIIVEGKKAEVEREDGSGHVAGNSLISIESDVIFRDDSPEDKKENDFLSISDSFSSSFVSSFNNAIEGGSADGGDNIEDYPILLNGSLSNSDFISISDSFMKRCKNIKKGVAENNRREEAGLYYNINAEVDWDKQNKNLEGDSENIPANNLVVSEGDSLYSAPIGNIDNSVNVPVNNSSF